MTRLIVCVISGFCHEVAENCVLLGYHAASSGNFLPMFQDNLSVPAPGDGIPKGCPEMSVRNYHYLLHDNPGERWSEANSRSSQFCKHI